MFRTSKVDWLTSSGSGHGHGSSARMTSGCTLGAPKGSPNSAKCTRCPPEEKQTGGFFMIFHDFSVIFANFANFANLKFTSRWQVMESPGFHSNGWDVTPIWIDQVLIHPIWTTTPKLHGWKNGDMLNFSKFETWLNILNMIEHWNVSRFGNSMLFLYDPHLLLVPIRVAPEEPRIQWLEVYNKSQVKASNPDKWLNPTTFHYISLNISCNIIYIPLNPNTSPWNCCLNPQKSDAFSWLNQLKPAFGVGNLRRNLLSVLPHLHRFRLAHWAGDLSRMLRTGW